ncbi:tail fiber protein [Xenorhabdus poinarii]|uniref:tail fiber protein n=1 Tax=Xenorhabdus poinarii TaxID=40577 RepID=UPI000A027334|nr:tail fiber protein [Xenorhabdus poinarii]
MPSPKAVKAAYDFANAANHNANGRVPAGRQVNGKALNTHTYTILNYNTGRGYDVGGKLKLRMGNPNIV